MSSKDNKGTQPQKVAKSFDENILELSSASDGLTCLLGSKCRNCGSHWFPQHVACLNCSSDDMEKVALSRRGKLYCFTIVEWPGLKPPNYPVFPYAYGYVDLPGGARVMAALRGCELDWLKIDMEMELATGKVGEDGSGNDVIGYWFEPVKKQ